MATADEYFVNIPDYTDVADIKKAFTLYHYGTEVEPDAGDDLLENSVAWYLNETITALEQAQNRLSVVPKLDTDESLNDVIVNGIYLSVDSPTTALNYPSTARGIVSVVSADNNNLTFQTYQSINPENNFWWRVGIRTGGTLTWPSGGGWVKASKDGHSHSEYLATATFNSVIDTAREASMALVTDPSKNITSSNVTADELSKLEGITETGDTRSINDRLNDKADAGHNHNDLYYTKSEQPKIFVIDPAQGSPSNPSVGDLWFW